MVYSTAEKVSETSSQLATSLYLKVFIVHILYWAFYDFVKPAEVDLWASNIMHAHLKHAKHTILAYRLLNSLIALRMNLRWNCG